MKKLIIATTLGLIYLNVFSQSDSIEFNFKMEKIDSFVDDTNDTIIFANDTFLRFSRNAIIVVYKTDSNRLLFIKEYNFDKILVAEGFARRHFTIIRPFDPKTKFVRHGNWVYYDDKGRVISECGYSEGRVWSGCVYYNYDEKGNIISRTYING
jgi:hypothetical protein